MVDGCSPATLNAEDLITADVLNGSVSSPNRALGVSEGMGKAGQVCRLPEALSRLPQGPSARNRDCVAASPKDQTARLTLDRAPVGAVSFPLALSKDSRCPGRVQLFLLWDRNKETRFHRVQVGSVQGLCDPAW
jgi:hypothetical protein